MPLVQLLIVLIVVGALLYLVQQPSTKIAPEVKTIITVVVVIVLVLWLVQVFGVFDVVVPRLR
jgi:hypothetical protein